MKNIILTMATFMLLFSGCSKLTPEIIENSNEMSFTAKYSTALTRATGTAFEAGDVMGVYVTKYDGETPSPLQISGNYANNSAVTFDGTNWSAKPAIYWEDSPKFDVYAYYPFAKLSSVDEASFSVALDQSTVATSEALSGYEVSDFLWAKNEGVTKSTSTTVPLVFKHRMSKLVVVLKKGAEYDGEIPTDAVVCIHNTVPVATIDIASGTVTKNPYESTKSITAKKVSDGVYTAIIIPQRLDTKRPLVEILSKGVSYLIESSFLFKHGTQHTINITLNNNPDKVLIEIGGEIEGAWE